jgi:hypothetical protein
VRMPPSVPDHNFVYLSFSCGSKNSGENKIRIIRFYTGGSIAGETFTKQVDGMKLWDDL